MSRPTSTKPAGSQNRTVLIVGTVIAAVLVALAIFAVRPGAAPASTKTFSLNGQPFLGQASAPVTLVVFEDYKCPNCKNFEDNTMPVLQSKYLQTGKIKLYRLNFPFIGPDSTTAAEAAECAYDQKGNDGYNQLSTLLFRAQQEETVQWATKDKLQELAGYVDGLDATKLRSCLDAETTKARVDADTAQANKAGVTGTPSVFVNGVLVSNYAPDAVSAAIDKAL